MATEHRLKTLAPYWDALSAGTKNFEVRRDDRGFQKGDILALRKMRPDRPSEEYWDGKDYDEERFIMRFRITYILTGGQLGICPGFVVMALECI